MHVSILNFDTHNMLTPETAPGPCIPDRFPPEGRLKKTILYRAISSVHDIITQRWGSPHCCNLTFEIK